jgi:hypothetical protein
MLSSTENAANSALGRIFGMLNTTFDWDEVNTLIIAVTSPWDLLSCGYE